MPLTLLLAALAADPAPAGFPFEARLVDGSTLRLDVLDPTLELVTKHGPLRVAVADVRRVELATRPPPPAAAARIAAAVAELGSADFRARERAVADLKRFGPRAFPALAAAARGTDPEVVRRAEDAARALKQAFPADLFRLRETDVIHTDDSVIAGTLSAASVRVLTAAFGEQPLRLAEVRTLGPANRKAADAPPAPPNLLAFQGQFGKEVEYTVTGAAGPGVYGTDVYTLDTLLAAAAVHAGQVKAGETGVVRVRVVPSPPAFAGTTRNGIDSAAYGLYPAGAFEFVER